MNWQELVKTVTPYVGLRLGIFTPTDYHVGWIKEVLPDHIKMVDEAYLLHQYLPYNVLVGRDDFFIVVLDNALGWNSYVGWQQIAAKMKGEQS